MGNHGAAIAILVLGTLISIGVGILTANQFESPNQYIIGLISEVIVILITVSFFFYTYNETLSSKISDYSILVKAMDTVRRVDDPAFRQRFIEVRQALIEIANGYYSLKTLAEVYDDDIASIDNLKKGEILRSMCPVGAGTESIVEQFTNKSFLASMDAHYRAAARGVIVYRIYIFESIDALEIPDVCLMHLKQALQSGVDCGNYLVDVPRPTC